MGENDVTSSGGAPVDPSIGKTIDGRYLIKRVIGRGGMGAVYEAQHLGLDRRVAVKFLLDTEDNPDAVARFRREARAASRIDHENVVDIFDVGTDNGVDFIAMEYVEGEDLRTILSRGALSPARAVDIARQILEGLAAIHEAGIVHRDIKPGNIVITSVTGREIAKIMDFGISKTHEPGLTAVGNVVGTPEYMAPEQRAGEATDHRADLYAVGLTLYAMIMGHSPTDAATVALSPSGKRTKIPPTISSVLGRALALRPDERYASAKEFAAALVDAKLPPQDAAASRDAETTQADKPLAAPATTSTRAFRGPMILLGAVVIGALIGVSVWQLRKHPSPPPKPAAVVATATHTDAATPNLVEHAQAAEREGKLDLAIARYIEANEATHDPELLFRIGELYERLDRTTEAIRYYERYQTEGPETGRSAAIAKIARLRPASPMDAGMRVVAASHAPNTATPPETRGTCRCVSDDPRTRQNHLCAKKHAPLCQCNYDHHVVCPTRLELCPGDDEKCPDDLELMTTVNSTSWGCRDKQVFSRFVRATPGGACRGYSTSDLATDPAAVAPERDAEYECNFCSPNEAALGNDRAMGFLWSGKTGEPCKGVYSGTGETMEGHFECGPNK